jgi:hypothetical protein
MKVGVPNGALCACGKELTGKQRTRCTLCAKRDPHRHANRSAPEMIVSVDCEGQQDDYGIMHKISVSYGREDGSSNTLAYKNKFLSGQEITEWLIDELSGHYIDANEVEWRQALVSFHFNWDMAVITKDFTSDLILVHSSKARRRNQLCNTEHDHELAGCTKIGRYDHDSIQDVISEGGESGLIALHTPTSIGIATTPKRRFYAEHRPDHDLYQGNRRIDIHDTGSSFTGTLLDVIDHWQPELSPDQQSIIEWGKQARKAGFLHGTIKQVSDYSESECIAHARCVRLLLNTIKDAANIIVKPGALYGSGSIASSAFKYHGLCTRLETHIDNKQFEGLSIDDIARLTYFGGLIETPTLGWVSGPIDESDLQSAYPSKAIHLPCMRHGHGKWKRKRVRYASDITCNDHTVGHVLVSWAVDTPSTPPFVVRTIDGLVRQPLVGSDVWVTMPEYLAAYRQFGANIVATNAVWWEQTCECPNPLAWLQTFYDKRLLLKQKMAECEYGSLEWHLLNVQQALLKLIINSAYGKLAQQRPTLGKYTNLHYAGYITGSTRSTVREESWLQESKGGTILYTHTDSVLSTNGHPIDGGSTLGAWSVSPKQMADLLLIQPGLVVSMSGGKTATRGCHKHDFVSSAVQWACWADLTQHPSLWPAMTIPRVMMISRRMALHRGKPELAGSFLSQPLTVHFNSGKRNLEDAYQIEGNPTGWIVPPIESEPFVATLKDLKEFQTRLSLRLKAGEFDHQPGEMTFDEIEDKPLDETDEFTW